MRRRLCRLGISSDRVASDDGGGKGRTGSITAEDDDTGGGQQSECSAQTPAKMGKEFGALPKQAVVKEVCETMGRLDTVNR